MSNNRYQYDTLNISLQTDNQGSITTKGRNVSKLIKTVDYQVQSQNQSQQDQDSDQKVKRFRQLYYKNQKLRRQLKMLNQKLNQKLEKVKLPNVSGHSSRLMGNNYNSRKKAMSVDLNNSPQKQVKMPNKAQQRQLQNAYRQIKMYKKQIQVLKVKQDTVQSYQRLRNMQNSITFRDKQIFEVQQQLKSIKNVKKMQEKSIVSDLQNEDVIQRISQYEYQMKNHRDKLKEMATKGRKREQQYKKQQAYQVALQKKRREINNDQQQKQDQKIKLGNNQQLRRQITDMQWNLLKQEIINKKNSNDQILIKIQSIKKGVKNIKDQNKQELENLQKKQVLYRNLQIKLQSLRKLIKQQDRVQRQKQKQKEKEREKIRLQQMQRLRKKMLQSQLMQQQEDSDEQQQSLVTPKQQSRKSKLKSQNKRQTKIKKDQRQWKGKTRKVQHGFMSPTDNRFQIMGLLKGLKVFIDQSQLICGLTPIIFSNKQQEEGIEKQLIGIRSNIQIKWQLQDLKSNKRDFINKIVGCFSEQGYLAQINLISKNGMSAKFGSNHTITTQDVFKFTLLDENQRFQGIFGSFRNLNKDVRITQLGFWIGKSNKDEIKINLNEDTNAYNNNNNQSRAIISQSNRDSQNVSYYG